MKQFPNDKNQIFMENPTKVNDQNLTYFFVY